MLKTSNSKTYSIEVLGVHIWRMANRFQRHNHSYPNLLLKPAKILIIQESLPNKEYLVFLPRIGRVKLNHLNQYEGSEIYDWVKNKVVFNFNNPIKWSTINLLFEFNCNESKNNLSTLDEEKLEESKNTICLGECLYQAKNPDERVNILQEKLEDSLHQYANKFC